MSDTIQGLLSDAATIKNETTPYENTASRVGQLFEDIINFFKNYTSGGDTPIPTPSTITGTLLLNGLNGMDNPSNDDRILHYSSSTGWGYIATPAGGSGTGSGLTWTDLGSNTNDQINISHLTNALGNYVSKANIGGTGAIYKWWGQSFPASPTNGVYKIDGAIEFSNGVRITPESGNHTLKIEAYDNSSNPAHLYTTGGVSALGNSSSGSGVTPTPGTTDLNNLLGHINANDLYGTSGTVSPSTGNTIFYNGTKWQLGDLENLLGTAPDSFTASTILAKDSNGNYAWISASGIGGSTDISKLWKIGDVGTSSGYSSTIGGNQILRYNNNRWENVNFSITPVSSTTKLQSISLAGITYTLPIAGQGVSGMVQANKAVSSYPTVFSSTESMQNRYYGLQVDSNGKGFVYIPWENTQYSAATTSSLGLVQIGNGIDVNSGIISTSISKLMGTSNIGDATHPVYWVGSGANAGWHTIDLNAGWVTIGTDQTITGQKSFTKDIILYNGKAIKIKDTNEINIDVLEFDSNNQLAIGWNTTTGTNTYNTLLFGNNISLYSSNANSGKLESLKVLNTGQVVLPQAQTASGVLAYQKGLKFGTESAVRPVLYYDSSNNALALQMSDGSACSFYATGGVSALGMSQGTSVLNSMAFNYLTVKNRATISNMTLSASGSIDLADTAVLNIHSTPVIQYSSDGIEVAADRFYLDDSRCIYVDNGSLKYYNGSVEKTIQVV